MSGVSLKTNKKSLVKAKETLIALEHNLPIMDVLTIDDISFICTVKFC